MKDRDCRDCKHYAEGETCVEPTISGQYRWMNVGALHVSAHRERCNIFGLCGPNGLKWEKRK